ncbi:DctP family TRAP transporter solute-binding subunit [Sediminivirga luteola]|uniref:ABC transporter substrate-binding protein n=1 Tax=Sediminivirga luteola TaxID=1774748 RepID=A0A8J2TZR2_9MICO|nr:DctP family TRAP transporter solute-binding subunit [Sediminivirga luteola]MCI2265130.1 DctP family TRAP transporter solute-binding subunit [Sediminivirga luteola]GGA22015.1 ABC transporter substrate-binding protein [Sediminivirga luteola]
MKRSMPFAMLASAGLVVSGCGGGAAAGDTYDWDFTITVSDASTWYAGAERFAEILEDRSDGRIVVNIFANEQLSGGDPAAGVEQLMNGDKAFSYNSTIIYSGIDERFAAINAPFLYDSYEVADQAIADGGLDAYKELSREVGVEMLGFGESGFRQVTNSKTPIGAPDDLVGLKVRVPGSSLFLDIYSELGADPVTMNFAEVFTSLQTGTIDGQENPFDVIHSNGLADVQEYLSVWNYVYDPLILGMNKDLYDSLSEEDRALVDEAAEEANALQIDLNREREAEQLAEFEETMQVTELSPDQVNAFREALTPVREAHMDRWTEDLFQAVSPE